MSRGLRGRPALPMAQSTYWSVGPVMVVAPAQACFTILNQGESAKRNPMDLFRASVQAWPEVVECAALTGEMDFQLCLVVADMAAYSRFMLDTLLKHPSVQDCKTSFVMQHIKRTTALPV